VVPEWFAQDSLHFRLIGMGIKTRDQDANERTWTVVDFFNFCVLDFLCGGGLQLST